MIRRPRILLSAGCLLLLSACASGNNPQDSTGDPSITAPAPTSDSGSRYLGTDAPIGAIPVETAPVDGTWVGGQTSIARPAPGSTAAGTPDGSGYVPPTPPSGDLPNPGVRQTPAPPPPPPLR